MGKYKTLVEAFEESFRLYPDHIMFRWREGDSFRELTYKEAELKIREIAVGLISLGVKQKEHVALIADVSQLWTLCDLSMQMAGITDVPRGSDSTGDELGYIISHSGSEVCFVHNEKLIDKINSGLKKYKGNVSRFIVMDDIVTQKKRNIMTLSEVIQKGRSIIEKDGSELKEYIKRREKIKEIDLVTIVYTSGTTGEPKGVMLTQKNYASQMEFVSNRLRPKVGQSALTILPPWHVLGRIAEYMFIVNGVSITYSSIKSIGEDLRKIRPHWVPAVPRIWEGVYNKVIAGVKSSGKEGIFNLFKNVSLKYYEYVRILTNKENLYKKRNPVSAIFVKIWATLMFIVYLLPKNLGNILVFKKVIAATGGRLEGSVSGGGALPGYVDQFFASIGIKILEGYGLTETTPVLAVRDPDHVVTGTVGAPLQDTEIRLIDLDGKDVTDIPDAKGTLYVRGPQVMQGYYKNPSKTKEVLSDDGWFNTGDLIKITTNGEISIVGRSKDTIVLIGGENVEPTPIEEKLKESPYIDHVMVVGQDKKTLGALIVPNEEAVYQYAKDNELSIGSLEEAAKDPKINALFKTEIQKLISLDNGFKAFEKIAAFRLLSKPFEQGIELNNTLKLKRHVVTEMYEKLIEEMYK